VGVTLRVLAKYGDFRRLWTASLLSETGSAFSLVALPLYVVSQTHSYTLAGVLTTVGFVGWFVMRIPGGYLGDRWPRRPTLIGGALVGAAAMTCVTICVTWHPPLEYWLIGLAVGVNGVVGAALMPIEAAAVRHTLPDDAVQTGFAAWQAQYSATTVIGPLLGAVSFTAAHFLPFAIDAGSFLLQVGVLLGIGQSLGGGEPLSLSGHDIFLGFTTVIRSRFLRVYSVTNALINVASQGMLYAMVFWMIQRGALSLGASFSVLAIGSFLGSMLTPYWKSHHYEALRLIPVAAYALIGLSGVLAQEPWVVVVALAIVPILAQPPGILLSAHVMVGIPDRLQSRVQGALLLIGSTAYPFGAAITGVVASAGSLHQAFALWGLVCGAILLSSVVPSWRLPREGLSYQPTSIDGVTDAPDIE